jgi:Tfp pilus assembly protein PilZ
MDSIIFDSFTLTNAGAYDIFIVKYDAAGNVVWAQSAGGAYSEMGSGLSSDANGYIYITGAFESDSITFGSFTLTNADPGSTDIFVAKYDTAGNVVWAKSAGGNNYDAGYGISTDAYGKSYVTGYFSSGNIIFGSDTLINSGGADFFVAKYDTAGNVDWAKSANGPGGDDGYGISVDAGGNSYVTGMFWGTGIAFGSFTLTSAGDYDIFVVKYDAAGNVVWAKSAGGSDWDQGTGISTDANGNSYVTAGLRAAASPSVPSLFMMAFLS